MTDQTPRRPYGSDVRKLMATANGTATPVELATAHAARLATETPAEADYAYIRAYLYAHSWTAAVDIYGAALVRAAMIPADLGHDPAPHSDQVGNPGGCPPGAGQADRHQQ
jgi:hypothetical protein